ncbi:hypothetical protein CC78DRAFT_504248 [Lojkania enalia]|uniref:Cap binding protein n=1 Tax=Lojkania enalia TaxID=147567 RepID=A0A9P4JWV5_9PLEO|nr:hypothetical protein CC78DRAFT_504248 [Didymosphaeria enalia]
MDTDVKQEDREDGRDRGRNRGGNSRKRRYEADDDDNQGRRGPPPTQRRRNDEPPRRRYEEPPVSKIRRLLLNIASSTNLPQDEATYLAQYLSEHYDDEDARAQFFNLLPSLLIEQPFKIPFAAAVAFYANDVKPDITAEAIKCVGAHAQDALNTGEWREFKLLLRFLACLQSLYQDDGIFGFLRQLFEETVVDLQSAKENDVIGIELVKIILLTIPYALVSGGSRFHGQAKDLLGNTQIVAENMVPIEGLIATYATDSEDKSFAYHSVIGLLQQQLMNEANAGWRFACIPRFDANVLKNVNDEESLPNAPPTYTFPTFVVPSPVNPGAKPIFPEAFFSLFADTESETVPRKADIACSLLRDAIVDTIDQLDFNREAAAKFLIDIDCYWSLETFAKRSIAFDKFRDDPVNKGLFKSEDMIVDGIFSLLFKLPNPDHKLVYYHSLITQCCKQAPAAIAPSLGRAIRFIYKHIDIMDLELANRFLDWFSHHLSNFEFRWRWTEWTEYLSMSDLEPHKAFILSALDKEIRLSFAKRIRSTVPNDYHYIVPESLEEGNDPEFKYADSSTPFAAEGQTLLTQFRKKAPDEEIQATIDKIHGQAAEQGIADVLVPSTDVFMTVICRVGSKSLSHFLSCIERGKNRLISIAQSSDAARRQILTSVVEYWKDHPGTGVNIVNKLLNYGILGPMTVIQWVLGDQLGNGTILAKGWVYEMVATTVVKVTKRNRQIASTRLQKGLPQDQVKTVDTALAEGRDSAREMFKYINDALAGVTQGAVDGLQTDPTLSQEDGELIRAWGKRWQTVFLRMAQVEESVIGVDAVETRLKILAVEDEVASQPKHDGNGVEAVANGGAIMA